MNLSNKKDDINWNNVVKKEVIGTGGLDLGEVVQVGDNFVIIQKGLLNKKRYIIPISTVENFDGETLKVKVDENDLFGYEEKDEPKFKDYSTFKSSDMSKEMQTKIPLISEDLQISKKIVEDKVDVIKDPIKETKTVEIELTYEKVTIERIPYNSEDKQAYASTEIQQNRFPQVEKPVTTRTQISIPLKREVPVIIKNPYIREEVIIKKRPVKETKTITTEVTNETLNYDNEQSSSTRP
ncbi:MAG TPA: DUF2382 domain-containing protein [Candidatus Nitrosocosmicus sp.]|nr:DUF2382 domain-containing protein [Candidatus Nitrosocosmicus sp.]